MSGGRLCSEQQRHGSSRLSPQSASRGQILIWSNAANYLVNGIVTCGNCHSPKGPAGDVADKAFSGGLSWDEPPFKVTAPNITQDKQTGIGDYTDAELKQVLRKGIKRNGVPVAMIMPSGFYEIMTDRDLDAVVAYLHTIKPITNTVPDPVYKMPQGHPIPPGGDTPFTEAAQSEKAKKGFYLVTIAHCMECHTPMGPHGREFAARLGAGGFEFPGPWGVSVSRNITSSKDKGIGAWTDDEIKRHDPRRQPRRQQAQTANGLPLLCDGRCG
jgi:mono/diheme cytochrome c family protein